MKKRLAILIFSLFIINLAACSTIQGFGKDVQKAGNAIEKSAE